MGIGLSSLDFSAMACAKLMLGDLISSSVSSLLSYNIGGKLLKKGYFFSTSRFFTEACDYSLCSNSSEIITYSIYGRGGVVSSIYLFYPKF